MATSNLLRTGEKAPVTTKGHGTGALGPSDTSDSGSDIRGGPGVVEESELGLDSGTSSDPGGGSHRTAGPDIGDYNLDADSDSQGTGERLGAGRDPVARETPSQGKVNQGEFGQDEVSFAAAAVAFQS